ncbi:hypothetical protein M5E89_11025 [Acidaminococcus intestini]|nr:hypothetical protein M5E89_11025 [Acidaminococcus intestini]
MPFEKIRILGIKGLGLAAARIASKKAKVSALIPRAVSPWPQSLWKRKDGSQYVT